MVAIFAGGITCLTSCDDDLVINKAIDESAYTGIYENNGYLRDGKSNLSSNVVELYKDTYTTSVKMSLSKMASTSTFAQVIIIIRKSKFPPNPERSVQFSGKRTKRSVQKKGCTQHL